MDEMQRSMMGREQELKRSVHQEVLSTNQQLALEKALARQREAHEALAATLGHISSSVASPLLTEDPGQATSSMFPDRVRGWGEQGEGCESSSQKTC
jgi:hypothetical protein